MKPIGEAAAAAAKAARHYKWTWCRHANGFCDKPLWRVVAKMAGLPLYQVVAFVNRLEEFANGADQRGSVSQFNAAEFGEALGMSGEDATRIFEALEHPTIGWVAYDNIADFYERNPDREDTTFTERKRRQRTRERAMKQLARQAAAGLITPAEREVRERQLLLDERLARQLAAGDASRCDIVTVTPEQSIEFKQGGHGLSRCDTPAASPQGYPMRTDKPELWLAVEGKAVVVARCNLSPQRASLEISRWRKELDGDLQALATILHDADVLGLTGGKFTDRVRDHILRARYDSHGQSLPLPPVMVKGRHRA
jgi:hypothetical protein